MQLVMVSWQDYHAKLFIVCCYSSDGRTISFLKLSRISLLGIGSFIGALSFICCSIG